MAGEKAKENKTLTSTCSACGKVLSTELLSGMLVGRGRQRRIVPVCSPCLEKGWTPPQESASQAA